jgi:hypothetical protein
LGYSQAGGAVVSYRSDLILYDGATTQTIATGSTSVPSTTTPQEYDSSSYLVTNITMTSSQRFGVARYAWRTGGASATLNIYGGSGHASAPVSRLTRLEGPATQINLTPGTLTNASINGLNATVSGGIANLGSGYLTNNFVGEARVEMLSLRPVTNNAPVMFIGTNKLLEASTNTINVKIYGNNTLAGDLYPGNGRGVVGAGLDSVNNVKYSGANGYGIELFADSVSGRGMSIQKTTGFAGIGTTNPIEKLHVNGNAKVEGVVTVASNLVVGASTGALTGSAQRVMINAGLPTTLPALNGQTPLYVVGTNGSGNVNVEILSANNKSTQLFFGDFDAVQQGGFLYSHSDDSLTVRVGGATKSTTLSNGLHTIYGSATITNNLTVGGSITLGGVAQSAWPSGGGGILTNWIDATAIGVGAESVFPTYNVRTNANGAMYVLAWDKTVANSWAGPFTMTPNGTVITTFWKGYHSTTGTTALAFRWRDGLNAWTVSTSALLTATGSNTALDTLTFAVSNLTAGVPIETEISTINTNSGTSAGFHYMKHWGWSP